MSLLVLLACSQSGSIDITADSGVPQDTGADTGDTGTTEPLEPDFVSWEGERLIAYDGCEETLYEDGWDYGDKDVVEQIQDGGCPDCFVLFELEVGPDEVCGLDVSTTTYRSLAFDGDRYAIWGITSRGELYVLAEDLELTDDLRLEYDYSQYDGALQVTGWVQFPALEE